MIDYGKWLIDNQGLYAISIDGSSWSTEDGTSYTSPCSLSFRGTGFHGYRTLEDAIEHAVALYPDSVK